jgi:hypothetical protein
MTRRARSGERGAAILVVVMVLGLLSALGTFAVRSSSMVDLASGYNRQLVQTHYIADYAVLGLAADIGADANKHSQNMEKGKDCVGFKDQVKQRKPTCARYSLTDIQLPVKKHSNTNTLLEKSTATAPGSLGGPKAYLEGDMKIELTDKHPAWPAIAGNQMTTVGGGAMLGYVIVTISAEGMVRPAQAAAGSWDTASATSAGIETSRAHVLMGPVPQ